MVKTMISLRQMLVVAAACLLGLCLAAPAAQAEEFGVTDFSTELSSAQAGASAAHRDCWWPPG